MTTPLHLARPGPHFPSGRDPPNTPVQHFLRVDAAPDHQANEPLNDERTRTRPWIEP